MLKTQFNQTESLEPKSINGLEGRLPILLLVTDTKTKNTFVILRNKKKENILLFTSKDSSLSIGDLMSEELFYNEDFSWEVLKGDSNIKLSNEIL